MIPLTLGGIHSLELCCPACTTQRTRQHPPTDFCCVFRENVRPCSDLSVVYTLLFHVFFFTMLPYSLSPMGKAYKELWVQRGWSPGAVETEPSSSRPHSTFLIYFASHLSQCVDCIIMAVTESHACIINDSAGPKTRTAPASLCFSTHQRASEGPTERLPSDGPEAGVLR